jgi:hypothetical protein
VGYNKKPGQGAGRSTTESETGPGMFYVW